MGQFSVLFNALVGHYCTLNNKPAANPLINHMNRAIVLCNSKVVYPSSDILPELDHPVIHGNLPATASEFPDTSLELLKRLVGPTYFTAFEGEAKK